MIITGSPNIEGYKIVEYLGHHYTASKTTSVEKSYQHVITDLKIKAEQVGANAIICLKMETIQLRGTGFRDTGVAGQGTLVKIEKL